MKKNIFVTMCLIILFSTYTFAQNAITRDEAYSIVKQKVHIDMQNNNVEVSKQIIPPNTVIPCMQDSITSPACNSWFFFIDFYPYNNWGHPCKYVFVKAIDKSLTIIDGSRNVYLPVDTLLRMKPRIQPIPLFMKKKSPVAKIDSRQKSPQALTLIRPSLQSMDSSSLAKRNPPVVGQALD